MNYSIIQSSMEKFSKYEKEYMEIAKSVNVSTHSLSLTNLSSVEKNRMWEGLFNHVTRMIEEIEFMTNRLNSVDFAEEEDILQEERDDVIQKYSDLMNDLRKEKEIITRQIENEDDTFAVTTPLQQKAPKKGYCYFCDTKITSVVPYQFSKEDQQVLEVEIIEGAGFCSQECLLSHCKEYKKREGLRQKEEIKTEEKIQNKKKLVTQIHLAIGNLRNRINNLIKKEKELKLDIGSLPSEKKAGFFRRIAQNLGLAKKESSPSDKLSEIKRKREKLQMEIKDKEKFLQQSLLILKISEQHQKVRKGLKKLSKRNAVEKKAEEEIDIDE